MFLLIKGRNVRAHLMKVGHGLTFRRQHPDRRPAKRLELIHQFAKISPKKKGDKLTEEQKMRKKDLAEQLSGADWVDEDGRVIKDQKTLKRIERIKELKGNINNLTLTKIRVAKDADEHLQAIIWYVNIHGEEKRQYVYLTNHHSESADAKWARCAKLSKIIHRVKDIITKEAKDGVEEAIILHLMFLTNMRIGNRADLKTRVKAYGATTLQVRHLKVDGDTVLYRFIGKSGVLWNGRIKDRVLADAIREKLDGRERREQVFSVSGADVNRYFSQAGDFSARDIRPLHATALARDLLKKAPRPRNQKRAKKVVNEICEKVAKKLHNTLSVAKNKYVDPIVWCELEEEFGIKFLKPKV